MQPNWQQHLLKVGVSLSFDFIALHDQDVSDLLYIGNRRKFQSQGSQWHQRVLREWIQRDVVGPFLSRMGAGCGKPWDKFSSQTKMTAILGGRWGSHRLQDCKLLQCAAHSRIYHRAHSGSTHGATMQKSVVMLTRFQDMSWTSAG